MDYKAKYEAALEAAKKGKPIEEVFPELAESEDEQTRKEILAYIIDKCQHINKYKCRNWIAWLEKQKSNEYSLEQIANIFLDALSKMPYNNKPVTDAQIITEELLKFLSDTNSYNPNALNEGNYDLFLEEKFVEINAELIKKLVSEYIDRDDIDENNVNHCKPVKSQVRAYRHGITDIIKLGKKPAKWSEEDEDRLQRIITFLVCNRKGDTDEIFQQEQDIEWLKSLHP